MSFHHLFSRWCSRCTLFCLLIFISNCLFLSKGQRQVKFDMHNVAPQVTLCPKQVNHLFPCKCEIWSSSKAFSCPADSALPLNIKVHTINIKYNLNACDCVTLQSIFAFIEAIKWLYLTQLMFCWIMDLALGNRTWIMWSGFYWKKIRGMCFFLCYVYFYFYFLSVISSSLCTMFWLGIHDTDLCLKKRHTLTTYNWRRTNGASHCKCMM